MRVRGAVRVGVSEILIYFWVRAFVLLCRLAARMSKGFAALPAVLRGLTHRCTPVACRTGANATAVPANAARTKTAVFMVVVAGRREGILSTQGQGGLGRQLEGC